MTGFFLLLSITFGVMALGQVALGFIMRLPFAGIHAAAYWVLVGGCVAFGLLALFLHFNHPTPGVFA